MENNCAFCIRVTGVLIENDKILLEKQYVDEDRQWSLPGGKAEVGESLEMALKREMFEETGLDVSVERLLYVCEYPEDKPHSLHITFLLNRVGGNIVLPTNEFDHNPIHDVQFIKIDEIEKYGFSLRFKELVLNGFPGAGSYAGRKSAIGL